MKKLATLTAALAVSLAALIPASAKADNFDLRVVNGGVAIGVDIGGGPVVVAPPPRPGYAWAPGYWAWDGYRYVWMQPRWVDQRPSVIYAPAVWGTPGPRWGFEGNRWREEHREHRREERHEHEGRGDWRGR
jgi:hypothetical protein